jgi:hypothetical protein
MIEIEETDRATIEIAGDRVVRTLMMICSIPDETRDATQDTTIATSVIGTRTIGTAEGLGAAVGRLGNLDSRSGSDRL